MSAEEPVPRGPYRRHSTEFKVQLCGEIRSGQLGRRDAQRKYKLSDNLIQQWLAKFDLQTLQIPVVKADPLGDCHARVAALERKIGQLTMALEGLDSQRRQGRDDRLDARHGSERVPRAKSS